MVHAATFKPSEDGSFAAAQHRHLPDELMPVQQIFDHVNSSRLALVMHKQDKHSSSLISPRNLWPVPRWCCDSCMH